MVDEGVAAAEARPGESEVWIEAHRLFVSRDRQLPVLQRVDRPAVVVQAAQVRLVGLDVFRRLRLLGARRRA